MPLVIARCTWMHKCRGRHGNRDRPAKQSAYTNIKVWRLLRCGFMEMNGNYRAGVLEYAIHNQPEVRIRLMETNEVYANG